MFQVLEVMDPTKADGIVQAEKDAEIAAQMAKQAALDLERARMVWGVAGGMWF